MEKIPKILKIITHNFGRQLFLSLNVAVFYNFYKKDQFNTEISRQVSLFTFSLRSPYESCDDSHFNSGSAEGTGEESRACPIRRWRKYNLKARKPALLAKNQYEMAALWSVSFSISTDTVKPLAVECRLGK